MHSALFVERCGGAVNRDAKGKGNGKGTSISPKPTRGLGAGSRAKAIAPAEKEFRCIVSVRNASNACQFGIL